MAVTPEQIQTILQLREENVAPKQIARRLGLRPAEVSQIIRTQAAADPEKYSHPRPLPPLKECLINTYAGDYFFPPSDRKSQLKRLRRKLEKDDLGGLAEIVVTRVDGHRYTTSSYLVDYWCLGVKDAFGPRRAETGFYAMLVEKIYAGFDQGYREISLEQAQAIIYGAVDYARQLGFEPHPDFERAQKHLGPRLDNLPQLTFGKDGKPFFINGPHDNPDKIIAILEQNVGPGNFDYVLIEDDDADSDNPLPGWMGRLLEP